MRKAIFSDFSFNIKQINIFLSALDESDGEEYDRSQDTTAGRARRTRAKTFKVDQPIWAKCDKHAYGHTESYNFNINDDAALNILSYMNYLRNLLKYLIFADE